MEWHVEIEGTRDAILKSIALLVLPASIGGPNEIRAYIAAIIPFRGGMRYTVRVDYNELIRADFKLGAHALTVSWMKLED